MKKIVSLVACLVFGVNSFSQLIVDDFQSGSLENVRFSSGESTIFFQTGSSILGKTRRMKVTVNQNPFKQSFQTTIKKGLLVSTAAYDVRGTLYLGYGKDKEDKAAPLNLDLTQYKSLKVEYSAKSTANGIYVMLFTGTSRGTFSKHVPAREGKFVFEIPLKDIKKVGPNYTLKDIDQIRFQFDSRSKTGCAMAINKIWFE